MNEMSPDADARGEPDEPARRARTGAGAVAGLCPECRHVRVIESERGSRFLSCRLAARDPRFRRYPPQPVLACSGWER
jgi:hypothetical protein